MSEKFVTADHHWFHEAIIRLVGRPFPDLPTMNAEMVSRWNERVRPNDLVYYAGDMFYKGHTRECEQILDQLNGKIHFIRGNHDKVAMRLRHRFQSMSEILELKQDGNLLVVCHYAMKVWNRSFHGSYHVYGHSHGQLPEDPASLSFDIGMDCWNFYPVSFDEVFDKMRKKEVTRGENRVETRIVL